MAGNVSGKTSGRVLGIDLGTTNSAMAVVEGGEVVLLENREGERLTPSAVAIHPRSGRTLVGQAARRQAVSHPERSIAGVKRLLGRRLDDPRLQTALRRLGYPVEAGADGDLRVPLAGEEHTPTELAALILRKLKLDAEARLGEEVRQAVITVPAEFDDAQRQAVRDAGRIAGLEVLRILNEPTAAALAYGVAGAWSELAGGGRRERIVAVYDLGGGTFDVSILRLADGLCEVLATEGDSLLGGDDFDQRVVEWLCERCRREHGVDLQGDRAALARLREAASAAKVELSTLRETRLELPYLARGPAGPLHLAASLTRWQLEELVADLIERTRGPALQAVREAGLRPEQIDDVVLVGGQTRMPAVVERVRAIFGLAAAPGSGPGGGPRRELHRRLNPEEVVARGAAVQAGVLAGSLREVLLLDVTPLSLGIETTGGVMTVLIPRHTTVPARKRETFTTTGDGQTRVEIHVVQGERPMAGECRSLGFFVLEGIQPAPRGVPRLRVTFDVDASGILHVSADESFERAEPAGQRAGAGGEAGREQRLPVRPAARPAPEELERLARAVAARLAPSDGAD